MLSKLMEVDDFIGRHIYLSSGAGQPGPGHQVAAHRGLEPWPGVAEPAGHS